MLWVLLDRGFLVLGSRLGVLGWGLLGVCVGLGGGELEGVYLDVLVILLDGIFLMLEGLFDVVGWVWEVFLVLWDGVFLMLGGLPGSFGVMAVGGWGMLFILWIGRDHFGAMVWR